jgi:replication factor C subunit 1
MERLAQDVFSSETVVRFSTGHSSSTRTCVIFDEINGMSSGDRGGLATLARFISGSRVPVICICNDRHSNKLEGITGRLAIDLPFEAPTEMDVLRRLSTICKTEGIALGRAQYFALARQAAGDLRSALNCLHLWSASVGSASGKDVLKCDPLAAAKDILKPGTGLERRMDDFFVDSEVVPEFVHDGLAFADDFDGWQLALDSMASGHEISQTMRELSMFDLLPAVAVSSSILPAALVPQNRAPGPGRQFVPECFGRMSKTNKNYRFLTEIAAKCSRNCFVPRSTFRDGVAELLTFRCYEMLSEGDEAALIGYLGGFEMTKDDMIELRETVDFGLNTFPEVKVGASFTRLFNASHSALPKSGDSLESERANYFITAKQQKKQTRAKKKG